MKTECKECDYKGCSLCGNFSSEKTEDNKLKGTCGITGEKKVDCPKEICDSFEEKDK